jgi:hypothetical protein
MANNLSKAQLKKPHRPYLFLLNITAPKLSSKNVED